MEFLLNRRQESKVTKLLKQYGLASITFTPEEKQKIASLESQSLTCLKKSFKKFNKVRLMSSEGQGEANARFLINMVTKDNAQIIFEISELVVKYEAIALHNCQDFREGLLLCKDDQMKAFLELAKAAVQEDPDNSQLCIKKDKFVALLSTCADQPKLLPELSKLMHLLEQCQGQFFINYHYIRLMRLNSTQVIQNLCQNLSYFLKDKVPVLNGLQKKRDFDILLTGELTGNPNLIALETEVIKVLATNTLLNHANFIALFRDTFESYDGSKEQTDSLIDIFWFILRGNDSNTLTQEQLDQSITSLRNKIPTIPIKYSKETKIHWEELDKFAVEVLKQLELENERIPRFQTVSGLCR